MIRILSLFILSVVCLPAFAQSNQWQISPQGGILRQVSRPASAYQDNIELSGRRISAIVDYEVDSSGMISLNRKLIWPQLRSLPNNTSPWWQVYRAYTIQDFSDEVLPIIYFRDTLQLLPAVASIRLDGLIEIVHQPLANGIVIKRVLYPALEQGLFEERWSLSNPTTEAIELTITAPSASLMQKGVNDIYEIKYAWTNTGQNRLEPGKEIICTGQFYAFERAKAFEPKADAWTDRAAFLQTMNDNLILETPNPTINQLFHFSKIRGSESIFDTKLGLVHSPGGGRYYGGFWANDQAEYIGPFFPYLNYDLANEASLNMYRLYLKEISDDYQNIRYSFEMEGDAPINPLDRGDAAMISYGALQYVLALSDREIALELKPLIDWCLEYCHRQLNEAGVVASESDEMEGRIETGNANLSTSALYYGALDLYQGFLASLGASKKEIKQIRKRKETLALAVESYFGSTVEGVETYKYYKEHKYLRHWVCLPLVVGIYDRTPGTVDALFDHLWTENGVHVELNSENPEVSKIFWDRATLYALRGTFLAGETERSIQKLEAFSSKRLLGNRVPYVVEAFPEGNMAHLSAESGLYCRVITEGMFGIKATGLNQFSITPRLPAEWEYMRLKKMAAFGGEIDISITRQAEAMELIVTQRGEILLQKPIKEGETINIQAKS